MKQLREVIETEGLCWERDREKLEEVFGTSGNAKPSGGKVAEDSKSLIDRYRAASAHYDANDDQSAQAVEAIISDIDAFLLTMEKVSDSWVEQDDLDQYRQRNARLIPKPEIAEKLLRYQVTLERSIDRTLTQLERIQRMRLGQPVAPPIKVQIEG
jgi:hypothetical protein